MKKVATLITGGAGFLGSFYCDKFIKNKHYVICVDNNEKKLKKLKRKFKKNFMGLICDISEEKEVKKLFKYVNKNFFVKILPSSTAPRRRKWTASRQFPDAPAGTSRSALGVLPVCK